jgi:hypothetical protein
VCPLLLSPFGCAWVTAVGGQPKCEFWEIVALGAALGGCAGSPVGDAIAGPEKLAQQDDAYCESIGAAKGTPQIHQLPPSGHPAAGNQA